MPLSIEKVNKLFKKMSNTVLIEFNKSMPTMRMLEYLTNKL